MLATAADALEAAAGCARAAGVTPLVLGDDLEGEARDLGGAHAALAIACARGGETALVALREAVARGAAHLAGPVFFAPQAPLVLLSGGETTVTVQRRRPRRPRHRVPARPGARPRRPPGDQRPRRRHRRHRRQRGQRRRGRHARHAGARPRRPAWTRSPPWPRTTPTACSRPSATSSSPAPRAPTSTTFARSSSSERRGSSAVACAARRLRRRRPG